jgi:hypothetical protein
MSLILGVTRRIGVLVLSIGAASCQGYIADCTFQASAERIPSAAAGSSKIVPVIGDMRLADEFAEFSWRMSDYSIGLTIANTSRTSAQVLWNVASFVDDTVTPQALLVDASIMRPFLQTFNIAPGASATFRMFPKDYATVYRDNPEHIYWFGTRALFMPPAYAVGGTRKHIQDLAPAVVGKTVTFRIPMVLGNDPYEYRFRFTVKNVRPRMRIDIGM